MPGFEERIRSALAGHLDPEIFEACVCDLLRDTFPGLVPIRGGVDSGMDGAIPDGDQEAFPLVFTTARDVIGNLTRSLESYQTHGGTRRKAVLATSQSLTPQKRNNLQGRAREMGFVLVQIVEREGIVQRLSRNPRWCHALGIPWSPLALSSFPKTRRPLFELEPVGRAADLQWLRTTRGDRVLSGQPGSGKTFVLYQLAKEGWGLFLIEDGRDAVAEALAEERPRVVIVDDAHTNLRQLDILRQLRRDMGLAFDIFATTWEFDAERVSEALGGLPREQIRRLELLTRKEILEIYRRAGIEAHEWVLANLIDQAANKPGLAVTLAMLFRRGGATTRNDLFRGEALRRNVTSILRDLVGESAEVILGCFAIGGDRGMTMDAVAEFLETTLPDLRTKVSALAHSGVLTQTGERQLAVWPRTIRPSLLRSVFFCGDGTDALDYRDLLGRAPDASASLETLIMAAGFGVPVPTQELRASVAVRSSPKLWKLLARLDPNSARWVLDHYRGGLADVARDVLYRAPEALVPRLLAAAAETERESTFRPSHWLGMLADWVRETADTREALSRRRLLVREASKFLDSGGDSESGLQALLLALAPDWHNASEDALGSSVTFRSGILSDEAIDQISALWQSARPSIRTVDGSSWATLEAALRTWLHPAYTTGGDRIPEATVQRMRRFAGVMLRDLASLAGESPGLAAGLGDLASVLGIALPLRRDPSFDLLYPSTRQAHEEASTGRGGREASLRSLAADWLHRPFEEVVLQIAHYEAEAKRIDHRWPRHVSDLCRSLAEGSDRPASWLALLVDRALAPDIVVPFLEAVLQRRHLGWQAAVHGCLESGSLAPYAALAVLRSEALPADLLERAIAASTALPEAVEGLCLRREVPMVPLGALLAHRDPRTALAAAVGEWESDPRGQVRPEVSAAWSDAVVRSAETIGSDLAGGTFDYWLARILESDSDVALRWILALIDAEGPPLRLRGREEEPLHAAVAALDKEQRRTALGATALPASAYAEPLVRRLVDRDADLLRDLLEREALVDFHLSPLRGRPDRNWAELAKVALEKGRDPNEIADAAFLEMHAWSGSGSQYWRAWEDAFRAMEDDPCPQIQEVSRCGRERAGAEMRSSEDDERREALFGR